MSIPVDGAVLIAAVASFLTGVAAYLRGHKNASAEAKATVDEARAKAKEDIRRALGPQTPMELLAVRLHNADAGGYGTKADHFGELGIHHGAHWLEKAKQCAAACGCKDTHGTNGEPA